MYNLSLSHRLLDSACNALQSEMESFIANVKQQSSAAKPLTVAESPMKQQLSTAEQLVAEFRTKLGISEAPGSQILSEEEVLSQKAALLHTFSEMWSIYQVAWQQNKPASLTLPTNSTREAGTKAARGLYRITETKNLNLIIPHQWLLVVPFGGGSYSLGSGMPTPYIVTPYWGYGEVWTWLSYAHEVGHHIYRNVKGLSDELKVNVTLELWKQKCSRDQQHIWFNWLEEVFADFFGLFRLGPAFAGTQQLMLPHLPRPLTRPGVTNRMLVANDENHPSPHLRVYLAIKVLERLGYDGQDQETQQLKEGLKVLSGGEEPDKVYALLKGQSVELPFNDMAETVLDILLDAELGALAEKNSNSPRSLKQVFYQVPEAGIEKLLVDHYDRMKSKIMGVEVQDSWRQLDEIVNDLNRKITDTIQATTQSESV